MVEQKQRQVIASGGRGLIKPGSVETGGGMSPKEIFGILRRHVLLIVILTMLGFIVGGVGWFLLRRYAPKYTAETFIRVLPPIEKDPTVIGGPQVNKDIHYGYRLTVASLLTRQSSLQNLLARDKIKETAWFKNLANTQDKRMKNGVKDLRKHLNAYAQRDGEFITVRMTCRDKRESANILNEMVDLFLSSQGVMKKGEIAEKRARLSDDLLRVQRELRLAEQGLEDIRRESGFTDLERRQFEDTITQRVKDLERNEEKLIQDMQEMLALIENLKRQAEGPVNFQVEQMVERDPILLSLTQQIAFMEASLAAVRTKFGENHRQVRQVVERINATNVERMLRNSIVAERTRQSNLQNARDQHKVLQSQLKDMETRRKLAVSRMKELDMARVKYEKGVYKRDERKDMLSSLKNQLEKLSIMYADPDTPKVKSVGRAPEPLEMSFPKWQMFIPGGMMLGLMLGIGIAFLIELLNDLVRMPRDVNRYLHIPLLGIIPDAVEDDQLDNIDLCHIVRQAPYSVISESYRRFRTNLKLTNSQGHSNVLLVSSGAAGEGKTSVAVNLATAFVAENRKVLLIDANFWRPHLHTVFPKPDSFEEETELAEFGLSTFLVGLCGYKEVIRSTGMDGFDVIDSGMLPSNPAELLSSPQMEQLIRHQRQNYDYVIIDGPPVLVVSAVKIIARLADATILVVNAALTRRGAALRAISELRDVDAPIAGCVLFAVPALKGGYFQEQHKSHQEYQELQLAHAL